MIDLILGSWPFNSFRYESYLTEWSLNPSKTWLVTPITFLPLLYQYVLRQVSVVGDGIYSWVILISTFFFWQCSEYLLGP